jgi:hypothetical protein
VAVWIGLVGLFLSVVVGLVLVWQTRIMAQTVRTMEDGLRLQASTEAMARVMALDVDYAEIPGVPWVMPAYTALDFEGNEPTKTDFFLHIMNLCDLVYGLRRREYIPLEDWEAWVRYFRDALRTDYARKVAESALRAGWYTRQFETLLRSEILQGKPVTAKAPPQESRIHCGCCGKPLGAEQRQVGARPTQSEGAAAANPSTIVIG